MKVLLLATLFISTGSFAQTMDLKALKAFMTQKQAVLETVYPGMSKRLTTVVKYETELGPCEVTETANQTVLSIEGERIIVYSNETYKPAATAACDGFETQTSKVLFYEDKPALSRELSELDESASLIQSISRAGNIVTLALKDAVTIQYDFSKPIFKNTLLIQDTQSTMTGTDLPDVDVNTIDLTKVLFCESADSDYCIEGDWSDVLY